VQQFGFKYYVYSIFAWKIYVIQNRRCTYKRNIGTRSCNRCCSGKAVSITCSECVFVALVIQQPKRMRRIIFSSVACPALHFSHVMIRYDMI